MTMMEKVFRSGLDLTPIGFSKTALPKTLPDGKRLIAVIPEGKFVCYPGNRDAVFFEPAEPGLYPVRFCRSFRRFLAVLCAAGDLKAVERLIRSECSDEWETYRIKHPKTANQKTVLRQLKALIGIRPSADPFGEVHAVIACSEPIRRERHEPQEENEPVELTEIFL